MPENPRIEELRRRVESDPASIAFAALAEEYRRMGRHEDAIETCRQGLQRHPAYLSARVTLGRALIEVGDFEGARAELETVLKSAPENLAAIRGLAQIHERLGHSTEMHPDLAELAARPLPVKEAPAPAPDLRGPAYTETPGPGHTDAPQPLKIDLPDTAGGHTEIEIDLPSPSPAHQTIDIDLPLEGGVTDGFEIDLPAALDAAEQTTTEIHRAPDRTDELERLERFLVAVQHARASTSADASAAPPHTRADGAR